ncbi:MAG: LPS export ABC transporter periplasmic protein LptC [Deltaproteobacteria bacterium]|nr:LPS export ABC transporter periplasmic protein LptC [Deltaproteobacteria bacterium]
MRRLPWLFALALALIVAGVAALALKRGSEPRAPASPPQPQVQLKLEDVRYSSTRQDRKEWELAARQVQYFQDVGAARLDEVRLTFYGQNGQQYRVTGGYAWLDPDWRRGGAVQRRLCLPDRNAHLSGGGAAARGR